MGLLILAVVFHEMPAERMTERERVVVHFSFSPQEEMGTHMARVRLSDPGVKQRLQDRLAAGVSKEAIARELGISKVTLYAWLSQLEEEMRAAVTTRRVDLR
jgi:DNA invertase Pin-like site-specific DNA recombinase